MCGFWQSASQGSLGGICKHQIALVGFVVMLGRSCIKGVLFLSGNGLRGDLEQNCVVCVF